MKKIIGLVLVAILVMGVTPFASASEKEQVSHSIGLKIVKELDLSQEQVTRIKELAIKSKMSQITQQLQVKIEILKGDERMSHKKRVEIEGEIDDLKVKLAYIKQEERENMREILTPKQLEKLRKIAWKREKMKRKALKRKRKAMKHKFKHGKGH